MLKKVKTAIPNRKGYASYRNKSGYTLVYYFPHKDKSKKVRHSLVIKTQKSNPVILHGREILTLKKLLNKETWE